MNTTTCDARNAHRFARPGARYRARENVEPGLNKPTKLRGTRKLRLAAGRREYSRGQAAPRTVGVHSVDVRHASRERLHYDNVMAMRKARH
jgi:hypothetical protein